jgi:hypothetical protein
MDFRKKIENSLQISVDFNILDCSDKHFVDVSQPVDLTLDKLKDLFESFDQHEISENDEEIYLIQMLNLLESLNFELEDPLIFQINTFSFKKIRVSVLLIAFNNRT